MKKILKIIPESEISSSFLNIKPAHSFIPEWYRLSPSTIKDSRTELLIDSPHATTATYKKCIPFFDAMTSGYMVFLNADIEVTRTENGSPYILWRTQRDMVSDHTLEQWEGFPCPEGYSGWLYKWSNHFGLKTPKNYSLLFTTPLNRFDLPFISISGIVDSDKYDLSVQFPFFIKDDFVGIIEKGTPIAQIIPIKNDSWKTEVEKFNMNSAMIRMQTFRSTIRRSYKNNYWKRKDYK